MIAFPAATKVWIAGGVTDMRCGMHSLAWVCGDKAGFGGLDFRGCSFCWTFGVEVGVPAEFS